MKALLDEYRKQYRVCLVKIDTEGEKWIGPPLAMGMVLLLGYTVYDYGLWRAVRELLLALAGLAFFVLIMGALLSIFVFVVRVLPAAMCALAKVSWRRVKP
jgi:hypothetical protein